MVVVVDMGSWYDDGGVAVAWFWGGVVLAWWGMVVKLLLLWLLVALRKREKQRKGDREMVVFYLLTRWVCRWNLAVMELR